MLFNSPEFLFLFLPVTLLAFRLINIGHGEWTAPFLGAASLVFYATSDLAHIPLLCLSIVANWLVGRRLMEGHGRRTLVLGVAANLCVLAWFKYAGLCAETANWLAGTTMIPVPSHTLPLGISFFTFTQIAFLVDCFRKSVREYQFAGYFLFVTYFPHLIAGPVLHHREMMPQFERMKGRLPDGQTVASGLFLIIVGLFKKVVIADWLGRWVDPAFANAQQLQILDAWTAALSYALQLYFDFSAYSEMAMGIGLLMGVRLPQNFDSPYKSRSIAEFWRRWHMTLGRFLRDYLYIPLGGSKNGAGRMYLALMCTMVLGGLWHGAAWTFVLWGSMHGLALVVQKAWERGGFKLPEKVAVVLTFVFVLVAWVPFRAGSWADMTCFYEAMFGFRGVTLPVLFKPLAEFGIHIQDSPLFTGFELLPLLALTEVCMKARNVHELWRDMAEPTVAKALAMGAVWLFALANLNHVSSFAYWSNF